MSKTDSNTRIKQHRGLDFSPVLPDQELSRSRPISAARYFYPRLSRLIAKWHCA